MKKIIVLSLSSIIIFSCNNTTTEKTPTKDTVTTITTPSTDTTATATETLVLDNGQKWKLNEEMKPFILAIENTVNSYVKKQSKDYKFLATLLNEKNEALINSCTMTGRSHDELHKWLHPHLERVEALEKATDEQQANDIIKQIQQSFEVLHQYFQ